MVTTEAVHVDNSTLIDEAAPLRLNSGEEPVLASNEFAMPGMGPALPGGDEMAPRLIVHLPEKTWEIPLTSERLTIGRDPDNNDVFVNDPEVSARHAYIEHEGNGFVLRDLRSETGTWLHSERIVQRTLMYGDTIRIGRAKLVFVPGSASEENIPEADGGTKPIRPPVVVIPGMLGSELWAGKERVWPDVRRLVSRPESFSYRTPLQVGGLVDEVVVIPSLFKMEQYSRLVKFLEKGMGYTRGKDLLEFPYDWRQDNRLSARQLAETIDGWGVRGPITIIAHSMGCLISRYYVDRLGGDKRVERLILIGGPHYGTPRALSGLLLGRGLLPFGLQGERLRKVFAALPSLYQMLPSYPSIFDQNGRVIDIFEDLTWLPDEQRPLLRDAAEFRRELAGRCGVPCVSVFGYGLKTITRAIVQRGPGQNWNKVEFITEGDGDNTIPRASAVVAGSEIHPVRQQHGALYVDNSVKMRLHLELTVGPRWQRHLHHISSSRAVSDHRMSAAR